jgi:branched-chain amino acid transport system substrate-binding protein
MSRPEITIGLSVSLSGKFHLQGQQTLQGARLWQSYINAQGGIVVQNGDKRSVRLIWYDDRSQTSCVRKNVFRLLRDDRIDVLLGPYSSSLTMAVVEIAEEYKKVLWNHGGSSDEIFRHGRRHLVGIASPASDYLRALPQWLAEKFPAPVEYASCIQGEEPSHGRLRVGFWNRRLLSRATQSILSPSTFPGRITTPSLVSSPVSLRRSLCWWAAFRTS